MYIRQTASLILAIVISCSLPLKGIDGDEAYKTEALAKLPLKTSSISSEPINYTYDQLFEAFSPLMDLGMQDEFRNYFSVLFRPDFPSPPHPLTAIMNGYRCLHVKMSKALQEPNKNELQLAALLDLMVFHKSSIAERNPDLALKIPNFGCPSCKKSAEASLGLSVPHEGYASPSDQ